MKIGFAGLLTLLFITLRLTDVIGWSWLWVLSPLWIPLGFAFGVVAMLGIVLLCRELWKSWLTR